MTPRYDQITLDASERLNQLQQILSPDPNDAGVWIHLNAWFHLGTFDKGFQTSYAMKDKHNGVYAFVLKGDVTVQGTALNQRDGLGLWDTDAVSVMADSPGAELLLMEVPMQVN